MRESEIKIIVVEWLLERLQEDEVIAAEMQYSNASNRADLVLSSPRRLAAFEIKSSYDDFRRYGNQEIAYRQTFLENHLVVPLNFLENARKNVANSTGLLTVDDSGQLRELRKAKERTRLNRSSAIAWLRHDEKKKLRNQSQPSVDLMGFTEKELTRIALQSIHNRLAKRFQNFTRERGKSINSDDLAMLSIPTRIR